MPGELRAASRALPRKGQPQPSEVVGQPDHEPGGASRSRSETNTLLSSAMFAGFAGIATPGPDETEATKFGWLGSSVTSRIRSIKNRQGHRVPAGGSKYEDVNGRA